MNRGLLMWCALVALGAGCTDEERDRSQPGDSPDGGVDGAPAVETAWLPLAETWATAMALDGTHLYFATPYEVARVPLAGGTPERLFALQAPPAGTIAMVTQMYVGPDEVVFVHASQAASGATKTLISVPRAGGAATTLATSGDVRSFLGVAFDTTHVYYSSFTSIVRVPRAGGTPTFVGESDQNIQYWIYSPLVEEDTIVWAEGGELFRMDKPQFAGEGHAFASLPGVGAIVAREGAYVVALSNEIAFQSPASAVVEVDPQTGAVGAMLALPEGNTLAHVQQGVAVSASDVWNANGAGLWRTRRDGGAQSLAIEGNVLSVVAGSDAVYAAVEGAIARVPL